MKTKPTIKDAKKIIDSVKKDNGAYYGAARLIKAASIHSPLVDNAPSKIDAYITLAGLDFTDVKDLLDAGNLKKHNRVVDIDRGPRPKDGETWTKEEREIKVEAFKQAKYLKAKSLGLTNYFLIMKELEKVSPEDIIYALDGVKANMIYWDIFGSMKPNLFKNLSIISNDKRIIANNATIAYTFGAHGRRNTLIESDRNEYIKTCELKDIVDNSTGKKFSGNPVAIEKFMYQTNLCRAITANSHPKIANESYNVYNDKTILDHDASLMGLYVVKVSRSKDCEIISNTKKYIKELLIATNCNTSSDNHNLIGSVLDKKIKRKEKKIIERGDKGFFAKPLGINNGKWAHHPKNLNGFAGIELQKEKDKLNKPKAYKEKISSEYKTSDAGFVSNASMEFIECDIFYEISTSKSLLSIDKIAEKTSHRNSLVEIVINKMIESGLIERVNQSRTNKVFYQLTEKFL